MFRDLKHDNAKQTDKLSFYLTRSAGVLMAVMIWSQKSSPYIEKYFLISQGNPFPSFSQDLEVF